MPDLTELRDELARVCGWRCRDSGGIFPREWWRGADSPHGEGATDYRACHHSRIDEQHPFPPNDLNALHTAIPKDANYTLSRTAEGICELRSGWPVPYGGEPAMGEYEAIGRWLLAVLKEKANA